ncbi:hypothetical protein ABZ135_20640 [Streptomyces sp. NPDC006339]|uniref:hypothetical protein n=1 Tax=Streptomyces sp. NPDC006339 TaxID=3156755 RepID=UPI0033B8C949
MRTRIRHGLAAALAVSALSLTAACGGGDADGKKDGADKPSAGQTSAGQTSAAPTSAAPAGPLTAAQMKAGALEAKDLPSGWKAGKAEDGPVVGKADNPACEPIVGLLANKVPGATIGADVHFERSKTTTLNQQIMTFPGTGAADFVKAVAAAVDTCTGFEAEAEDMKMKATVKKLTAPQGAEQVTAFRLTLSIPDYGYKTELNLLVAGQGGAVTRLGHDPADAAGHKDFDALAKLAADKFVKAAQG